MQVLGRETATEDLISFHVTLRMVVGCVLVRVPCWPSPEILFFLTWSFYISGGV